MADEVFKVLIKNVNVNIGKTGVEVSRDKLARL